MYLDFRWTVRLVAKTVASPEHENRMLGIQYIIASILLRQESLLNFIRFSLDTQVVNCVPARPTERHIIQHERTLPSVYTFSQHLSVCLSVNCQASYHRDRHRMLRCGAVRWQRAAYELQHGPLDGCSTAISQRADADKRNATLGGPLLAALY